ncbi:hypothetical protein [Bacillus suaedaesalsae]|uniref:DUF4304 domain-containing protein n=1 Tax=Bacillus suaedaesalsae TaxID=2810349 RepID=A0ABS2DCZ1_9BACI|nr:hypothetical protein [Bacillus suaedaesalsae]MBM6616327.1 hypothetical protein [Bacillus suaedaesalsae]
MNPKELLLRNIESFLENELKQLGFKYSRNVPRFTRRIGDLELNISFSQSKWNTEDYCEFWTMWSVTSNTYSKWYLEQWGNKPANKTIVGDAEWNIPGWTRNASNHFILTNSPNDMNQMIELKTNIENIGIPFYEKIKDWNTAAEYASKSIIVLYNKVCDFYLLADEPEKAKEILEQGIKEIEQRGNDQLMQLPEIEKRSQKYFKSVK